MYKIIYITSKDIRYTFYIKCEPTFITKVIDIIKPNKSIKEIYVYNIDKPLTIN